MTPSKAVSFQAKTFFWFGFLVISILLIWALSEVLAPFITGLAIAYLLNPVVTRLSQRMPRLFASLLVLLSFTVIVCTLLIILSPLIGRQVVEFVGNIPTYFEHLRTWSQGYIDQVLTVLKPEDVEKIKDAAGSQVGSILKSTQGIIGKIWSGSMAVIDIVTFLVITPIVAFYCMRDWPSITKRIDKLFPRDHAKTLRSMFKEFDMRLSGFVRGQVLVCIALGTFYATGLSIVGLNFGLAIGFIAGLLSFIPFVGSAFGFIASVGVALTQYPDFKMPLIVAGIFFAGQFIEGNFLTPKLVGDRIGVHPVWVIFALLAGGKLFGFTGMLLAVPVAALVGVVVRYGVMWYEKSPAYLGTKKA